jgi:hypothetical protein
MIRRLLLCAALSLPALPALAADGAPAARAGGAAASPAALTAAERSQYREVFAAIRASDWAGAAARLDGMGDGPLHAVARAEIYLAKGSPRVELEPLLALIARAPELPHAAKLGRLATTRGAIELPAMPLAQELRWQGGQPRRGRARPVNSDPIATELETVIQPLIVNDQPSEAEAHLLQWQDRLIPEARTEYQQRIGWSYYLNGRDQDARRLSDLARAGAGEWAIHGEWTAGLASWRLGDCAAAANHFAALALVPRMPSLVPRAITGPPAPISNAAGRSMSRRGFVRQRG